MDTQQPITIEGLAQALTSLQSQFNGAQQRILALRDELGQTRTALLTPSINWLLAPKHPSRRHLNHSRVKIPS